MRRIVLSTFICVALGSFGALKAEEAEADSATVVIVDEVVESPVAVKMMKQPHDDLYQHPYSLWRRCENWPRLAENAGTFLVAGAITLGILELLPEDATAWNKKAMDGKSLGERWWMHVKDGPVWDSDQPIFNYILHPYAGAVYYMSARSQGFNVLGSLAYCAVVSTCFWELGIECFNEVPSMQDLIITPIGGMLLGESFYLLKRHIVAHGYRLWGSPVLGNIVAFVIDPFNEVLGLVFGNSARQWIKYRQQQGKLELTSSLLPSMPGMKAGISLNLRF